MSCKSCSTTITRDEVVIVCEGFCANTYHAQCVDLTTDEKKSCLQNAHIFWICTSCSKMLREVRYGKTMQEEFRNFASTQPSDDLNHLSSNKCDVTDDIIEMKKEIATIQQALTDLTASRLSVSCMSVNERPIAHSSPTLSEKLLQGSRDMEMRFNIDNQPQSPLLDNDNTNEKCWLFFTRIKNDVPEHEMHAMVADSLGSSDTFFVKKLVPDWKDTSMLPFVSFKVGIHVKFKDQALRSSTWPKGIYFREFRERYIMWEPRQRV